MMNKVLFATARGLRSALVAVVALAGAGAVLAIGANYTMTQGVGTTFASAVISAANYVEFLLCDATAGSTQCAAVNSSGQVAIQAPPSLPLPTGASTAAGLTTINTTLGTPMQATGGSVTANAGTNLNTSLLALESGGNLATLAGAVTAAVQQTNEKQINGVVPLMGNGVTGTGSQRVTIASDNTAFSVNAAITAAALPLPALASTSTKQSDGSQKTQIVDGSGNVIAATSNALNVQCANCSGSGVSTADAATFTAGSSLFAGSGGQFTSGGATACVTGHQCEVGITAARAFLTDLSSQAGTAITSAPSAYGTAPTGNVIGVNAFVTNTNANGSAVSASSSPVVIASDQAAVAVKAASAAFASGSIASGAIASGAVASGAFASGAFAAGSFTNATAADACMFANKTNLAISQNGTSSVQLIALSGSTTIYVCSLSLIAAGATTVALTTGTGTACVSGNAAVIGTTTSSIANSISLAANGGLTLGNGGGTVAKGAASSELCMILGTSVFVSGNLTYVQI